MFSSRAVLISSSLLLAPLAVPVRRFARLPASSSPRSAYRCLGSSRSIAPPGLSRPSSYRHLILLACRFSIAILSGLIPIHGGGWRTMGTVSDGLFFFSCAVFLSSLSFAPSSGSPPSWRRMIVMGPTGRSRRRSIIISSGSSYSSPLPPSGSSWKRGEAGMPVIFQASNGIMASISSWSLSAHHLIPSPS